MDRALRRHHERRIKQQVAKHFSVKDVAPEYLARAIGMRAQSRALCSCPMCGNPRRHFGHRTLAELRHIEVLKHELK